MKNSNSMKLIIERKSGMRNLTHKKEEKIAKQKNSFEENDDKY